MKIYEPGTIPQTKEAKVKSQKKLHVLNPKTGEAGTQRRRDMILGKHLNLKRSRHKEKEMWTKCGPWKILGPKARRHKGLGKSLNLKMPGPKKT